MKSLISSARFVYRYKVNPPKQQKTYLITYRIVGHLQRYFIRVGINYNHTTTQSLYRVHSVHLSSNVFPLSNPTMTHPAAPLRRPWWRYSAILRAAIINTSPTSLPLSLSSASLLPAVGDDGYFRELSIWLTGGRLKSRARFGGLMWRRKHQVHFYRATGLLVFVLIKSGTWFNYRETRKKTLVELY